MKKRLISVILLSTLVLLCACGFFLIQTGGDPIEDGGSVSTEGIQRMRIRMLSKRYTKRVPLIWAPKLGTTMTKKAWTPQ